MKNMWLGVVHHVLGEHEWADGQCSHGPLISSEEGKTFLSKGSKSAEAVRKIVFDDKWLKSLHYYNTFRFTCFFFNSCLYAILAISSRYGKYRIFLQNKWGAFVIVPVKILSLQNFNISKRSEMQFFTFYAGHTMNCNIFYRQPIAQHVGLWDNLIQRLPPL